MNTQDIVVVGASAGGVQALIDFVTGLPPDLAASIFVVLHLPAHAPSQLPEILSRAGPIKARHAVDGELIQRGQIYVAPPDHHLLIEGDRTLVRRGPKENRFRPSIDALFRSVAYSYGPRAMGIVLSGVLDDGTSGLWTIKRLGGVSIVQEPDDAMHPEMPRSVLQSVEVDYVLPAARMGDLLERLTTEPCSAQPDVPEEELKRLALEIDIAIRDNAFQHGIMHWGPPTPYTCPECHGILIQMNEGPLARFRCHTGHAYTASALLAGVTEAVESMLWQAMRGLEETTMLLQDMGERFKNVNQPETADLFFRKAKENKDRARVVHDSLPHQEQLSKDIQFQTAAEPDPA